MRSILISGDRSGAGKTSVTIAIASILSQKHSVQTYKVAMDYIDTSYLAGVTKRPSYNLDTFVQGSEEMKGLFTYGSFGAEYGIVEGVRGLYEGIDALSDIGSTASVAKQFNLPIILVINARSITRSAAALVKGFQTFDPELRIQGVILNNVMGDRHVHKATTAIEEYCDIPVLGAIPRNSDIGLPMRHLGLIPYSESSENDEFHKRISMITNCICEHLNIDAITKLAEDITPTPNNITKYLQNANTNQTGKKIAIAADEAFTFQYGELDAVIKSMGAETIRFSPIHDRLPEADGYIFGGGYPELYSSELEANDTLRSAVYDMAVNDVPIYAECGGLMYLTRSISYPTDWRGHNAGSSYDMCGVFSGDAKIPEKKVLGYVTGTANLPCGQYSLRGHEFHYSTVTLDTGANFRYMLSRGKGIISGKDGVMVHHTLGAYTHLMPIIARRMLGNFFNLKNE